MTADHAVKKEPERAFRMNGASDASGLSADVGTFLASAMILLCRSV